MANQMRTYTEDDEWGISYVMFFCRPCNVMVCGEIGKISHVEKYHKERLFKHRAS